MRIGINLTSLRPGLIGGSETYVRSLLTGLQEINSPHHFFVFTNVDAGVHCHHPRFQVIQNPQDYLQHNARVSLLGKVANRLNGRSWMRQIYDRWPGLLREHFQLDLWFDPLTTLSPGELGCASVLTILDLQHEALPSFFPPAEHARRSRVYPTGSAAATRIIAISEFAKQELIQYYRIAAEKIDAIPLAAPTGFVSLQSENPEDLEVLSAYGIHEPFCFYPANSYPHKNHVRLLQAFRLVRQQNGCDDLQLVLTGASQWAESEVAAAAVDLIECRSVVKLGHIPFEHLPILYRRAEFMVFPSLYEGFGIPILEAMQSHCPVLTTRGGSIPEVAGDAAHFIDGKDCQSIAQGIVRMHRDEEFRDSLKAQGHDQALKFSYRRCAEQTLETLERACDEYTRWEKRAKTLRHHRNSEITYQTADGTAACIGRQNIAYDRSFLQFRCADATEIHLALSPFSLGCRIMIRVNGVANVERRLLPEQRMDISFPTSTAADGLVRLDFRMKPSGWNGRLGVLRKALESQIESLIAIRSDGTRFQVIGEFVD